MTRSPTGCPPRPRASRPWTPPPGATSSAACAARPTPCSTAGAAGHARPADRGPRARPRPGARDPGRVSEAGERQAVRSMLPRPPGRLPRRAGRGHGRRRRRRGRRPHHPQPPGKVRLAGAAQPWSGLSRYCAAPQVSGSGPCHRPADPHPHAGEPVTAAGSAAGKPVDARSRARGVPTVAGSARPP